MKNARDGRSPTSRSGDPRGRLQRCRQQRRDGGPAALTRLLRVIGPSAGEVYAASVLQIATGGGLAHDQRRPAAGPISPFLPEDKLGKPPAAGAAAGGASGVGEDEIEQRLVGLRRGR